jgi:hypothetical protein
MAAADSHTLDGLLAMLVPLVVVDVARTIFLPDVTEEVFPLLFWFGKGISTSLKIEL